jgi:hypothetical protein
LSRRGWRPSSYACFSHDAPTTPWPVWICIAPLKPEMNSTCPIETVLLDGLDDAARDMVRAAHAVGLGQMKRDRDDAYT